MEIPSSKNTTLWVKVPIKLYTIQVHSNCRLLELNCFPTVFATCCPSACSHCYGEYVSMLVSICLKASPFPSADVLQAKCSTPAKAVFPPCLLCHPLLVPMKSRVMFHCPRSISGGSQLNSVAAFSTGVDGDLFKIAGEKKKEEKTPKQ